MRSKQAEWGVHVALMATMVIWGLNISAVKWLTPQTDIMLLASLRMLCATLLLAAVVLLLRGLLPHWRGKMLAFALLSAALMVYGNQTIFAAAMDGTTATNASLILALNPLLGGVMEAIFFRKRMPMSFIVGALIALIGVALVVLNRPGAKWTEPSLGDFLVLASMISFALGVIMMQRLSRDASPLAVNAFLYLAGTAMLLSHTCVVVDAPVDKSLSLDWQVWACIVFSGVGATGLGAVAWGHGVARLGMGRASVYMSWVPVLGVGFAALLLNEPLTLWHLLGVIAVLTGTAISSARWRQAQVTYATGRS
ncbi:carboxylate/amino acid/amine transporter [compost metagenome]